MLKFYVRRSQSEDFQKVANPPKDNVWIHGDTVTEHDLSFLVDKYDFDPNVLRDVLDKNELPRVEQKNDGLYVFVRTARKGKKGKLTTAPLLLALKGSVFANVSGISTDGHALQTPSVIAHASDTAGLLLGTFATVVSEYEALMQRAERYITDTDNRLRTHEVTNDDFIRFVAVENDLNEYHTSLSSMQVVAERLRDLMNGGDREAVEDILLYIRQLLVAIASLNQSIVSIRNAYSTIANNVLNQRMKTLTVLTVLIALPNVLFGMYGMNVALPLQDKPWVYAGIVVASVGVIGLVFMIGRKRGVF